MRGEHHHAETQVVADGRAAQADQDIDDERVHAVLEHLLQGVDQVPVDLVQVETGRVGEDGCDQEGWQPATAGN